MIVSIEKIQDRRAKDVEDHKVKTSRTVNVESVLWHRDN